MNRRVFALGETLLDIIFENDQPIRAVAGGSMVNAAISLGRMGVNTELLSEFGTDQTGHLIASFLERNQVGYKWCQLYKTNKTSLALAFLNEKQDASYSFYHDTPVNLSLEELPEFTGDDIILFGSFYSIKEERRLKVKNLLQAGRRAKSILIYDPNIRQSHYKEKDQYLSEIIENIQYASIVKGSDDDFHTIFGTRDPEDIYSLIGQYCPIVYITRGSKDLVLITPGFTECFHVPEIDPVSTIGAGDNFNAGLIFGLFTEKTMQENLFKLSEHAWRRISSYGLEFAKASCLSIENYIPLGFNPKTAKI